MRDTIKNWLALYEMRSLRERVIIVVTLLTLTWGIWISSLGGYVIDQKVSLTQEIERLAADLKLQNSEANRLRQADRPESNNALRRQQEIASGQLAEQNSAMDVLLRRFVAPEQVPVLLEDMLSQHRGLKLVRITSREVEPLLVVNAEGVEVPSGIFKHPVSIELQGGYLDLVAYLQALEDGTWHFTWRKLEYEVQAYPMASVMLEVETLSRSEDWLGV